MWYVVVRGYHVYIVSTLIDILCSISLVLILSHSLYRWKTIRVLMCLQLWCIRGFFYHLNLKSLGFSIHAEFILCVNLSRSNWTSWRTSRLIFKAYFETCPYIIVTCESRWVLYIYFTPSRQRCTSNMPKLYTVPASKIQRLFKDDQASSCIPGLN